MKKRIMSLLMVLCLVVGVLPVKAGAVTADSFTDVSKDSWYYDYVDYVAKKGYFAGTTKTTFSPNKSMTRAMFVVVLARHDGVTVDNSKSSFSDVAAGAWCAGAVNWAAENGIVLGYPDGTFKPNESITRAQMCSIMDNYVNYYTAKHKVTAEKKGTSTVLADQNEIPAYAKTAVKNCQTYGLITGYGDGTFRPQTTSTRAQVAAVIYRLSFLTESAQPSSGGGGVGGDDHDDHDHDDHTVTTKTYLVRVQFSTPNRPRRLELTADYTVTTTDGHASGDTTVNALATELVSGENATALQNAIQTMLDNVKGRSATATVSGQTVTVNVSNDEDPVISATTTVPVSDIVNHSSSGVSPFALTPEPSVTVEDVEALVAKLEAGGELALTTTDISALDKVLDKLGNMNGNDILEYVNENGSEAMQQAATGLTKEAIDVARTNYLNQLRTIRNNVNSSGGVVNIVSPVTMTVVVNLQSYLTKADNLHGNTAKKDQAIEKLAEKLGVSDRLADGDVSAAVNAIYALSKPSNFVTTSGNNLVLKSNIDYYDDYYDMLVSYVYAMCDLWAAVGEDSAFYATQLGNAQTRANGYSFLDIKYPVGGVLANLMGTTGNITNTTTGAILDVDAIVTDGTDGTDVTYPDIVTLLQNNLRNLGYPVIADQIPGSVPGGLNQFLGTYNLKVLIEG